MFRLIAVTLAALYGIFHVFGDDSRRPEVVARAEPLDLGLIRAAYSPEQDIVESTEPSVPVSAISDAEAVQIALAAGAEIRADRKRAPLRGHVRKETVSAVAATEVAATSTDYWVVTGSRVNLRSGPGTANAVVGQLTQGAEAEVLSDSNGWYEIRTADGATSGWIFGRFLQPG